MSYFEDIDKNFIKDLTRTKYSRLEEVNFQTILNIFGNEITPFTEFYIAPFIFRTPSMCINIPLACIDLNNNALRELLCHFQKITVLTSKEIPFELRLENLEPKSKEIFSILLSEKKINPFVLDLYQFYGEHDSSGDFRYVKFVKESSKQAYEDLINSNHIKDFNQIWSSIKQIYSDTNYVYLNPNWLFSEHLKDSIALNYFSMACKEVYLCVDNTTSRIINLLLSNDN
ncbi:hypothetical protein [Paenibacillus alba]|uniref:DUF2711 family protein n=1 Tax=Paenibacillus alba TaxID=1197127 RepID=A0ABU6G7R0_9BACL|nr:hypothetical protein [Paenibacillus alba]MEC0228789.1 hypothetical protein [Paenibacillus alba]